ncbi:MAG TPA: dihydrolipoamide acetyltransferase family protein [Candidatus Acidoferrales bacterium]|nr:dihydrolipoamide acetyltransferase family protein [Candidatus Acidoferrales bacterium]
MAISIVMPALELMQETGKVVSWRKKEGEKVAQGEILLEIETDKAVVEVEALAGGILAGVKAQPGDVIPVGHTIAWLVQPGEAVPEDGSGSAKAAPAASAPAAASAQAPKGSAAAAPSESKQVRISPKARRLAREHGVDIGRLRGTGPDGEILAADILAAAGGSSAPAASAAPAAAPAGAEEKVGVIGRLMAERTTQSWTTVPHFFVMRELDATALNAAREKFVAGIEKLQGVRPTHTDLLVGIAARVLLRHPRVNATWTGQGIRLNSEVNIGVAMAVEDGVVATVIRNAHKLGVAEIALQRRELTERARANRLRPEDIGGATFTISNLGMHHVDAFTAIIVAPQAAILAVGAIADRVVPVDGKPGIRPVMTLTLSSDHRVVDGARAAAFMHDLVTALGNPEKSLG